MAMTAPSVNVFATSAFPRILAIERDPEMRRILEQGLAYLGFDVKVVSDARVAADSIRDWMPEAILLDARITDIDAFSAIANLRRITEAPILMLSSHCVVGEKVLALTCGADDYIAEPFDWQEVAACIHARLRRPRIEKREVVTYADVTIDVTSRKAARAGLPIELSAREFDLLLTLARHPEQVFTRTQLLDLVWGVDRDVTPATVETYISYLRSKMDDGERPLIQTLRGVGYTMSLTR